MRRHRSLVAATLAWLCFPLGAALLAGCVYDYGAYDFESEPAASNPGAANTEAEIPGGDTAAEPTPGTSADAGLPPSTLVQ
jgi:hypothetical protein